MRLQQINPLWWGALAAIGVVACETYSFFQGTRPSLLVVVRLVAFIVFLILLLLRSRFAWHALGIAIVFVTPLVVLFMPPDAGLKYRYPNTFWLPHLIFTCLGLVLLWKSRKSYFEFIAEHR
jgi:hypothetical protein